MSILSVYLHIMGRAALSVRVKSVTAGASVSKYIFTLPTEPPVISAAPVGTLTHRDT